jgi:hypothetical protein
VGKGRSIGKRGENRWETPAYGIRLAGRSGIGFSVPIKKTRIHKMENGRSDHPPLEATNSSSRGQRMRRAASPRGNLASGSPEGILGLAEFLISRGTASRRPRRGDRIPFGQNRGSRKGNQGGCGCHGGSSLSRSRRSSRDNGRSSRQPPAAPRSASGKERLPNPCP